MQRPVTVLAVLFGLLLGIPGAQPRLESHGAQLGSGALSRSLANLRNTSRAGEEKRDSDGVAPTLSASPAIVTELLSSRPVAAQTQAAVEFASLERHFAYRARAPPAA